VNCTHQSLINFAKAYPKYLRTILKPIYWRNIKITFTEDIIRSGDLKYLINYLNKNLRQLTIESISENDYYDFDISCEEVLWHIIKQTSNLTYLTISNSIYPIGHTYMEYSSDFKGKIISIICDNLPKLRYLDIQAVDITDDQLIMISNKLIYLHSIKLYSDDISDDGLKYFINKSRNIINIYLHSLYNINDSSINLLFDKHYKTLETLGIKFCSELTDDAFNNIYKCEKLKELELYCLKATTNYLSVHLSKLNTVDSLSIAYLKVDTVFYDNLFCQGSFLNNGIKLKRLQLDSNIEDYILDIVSLNCPNIEDLRFHNNSFHNSPFTKDGLERSLSRMKTIEFFGYSSFDSSINRDDNRIILELMREIPNNILPNVELIVLKGLSLSVCFNLNFSLKENSCIFLILGISKTGIFTKHHK
jgi:hypothetical protein